ncbi:unnamed protein product (mitochondrion) [Plasmodiophora brassicae]|uniref:Protein kinase domain-containing protein n=1 Tax=Plasmodiophora brassicae TaxID=37360 RepID=A0A3P3YLP3_PLABS|nr:unnamed protein product [Plasmodiophora brassicae]
MLIVIATAIVAVAIAALGAAQPGTTPPPPMPCRLEDFETLFPLREYKGHYIVNLVRHKATNVPYALKKGCKKATQIMAFCTMQDADYACILMEYLPGGNLYVRCPSFPTTAPEHLVKFYVASTVLVLEKVHQKGMFYSLLNPENVFVDAKGYIRIVDFSTSRFFPRGHKLCFFQGKLEFASPEMVKTLGALEYFQGIGLPRRYAGYDQISDIWALGIFVCALFVGTTPFAIHDIQYESPEQWAAVVACAILSTPEPDIPVPSALPPLAQNFVRSLLRHSPRKRPKFDQIKTHAWFRGFDWGALAAGIMKAPYEPARHLSGPFDRMNFMQVRHPRHPVPPPPRPKRNRAWDDF